MEDIKDLINKKRALTVSYNNGYYMKEYTSILDFSNRTVSKIIHRMLEDDKTFGCSVCDWNDTIGDIHHINGRKIKDANDLNNLCYLCPNCHRKVHKNIIEKNNLISFDKQVGDKWKKYALSYREHNLGVIYRKEIKILNDKIQILKNAEILSNLKKSKIDFNKFGWVKEAAIIIKISPQKVGKWMSRECPDFYDKCYKRN